MSNLQIDQMVRLQTPRQPVYDKLLVRVLTIQPESNIVRFESMEDRFLGETTICKGSTLCFTNLDKLEFDTNVF